MKSFLFKLNRFFEIYIGPFFINGYKQEEYSKRMFKKYGKNES
jgi:hypothetical protein